MFHSCNLVMITVTVGGRSSRLRVQTIHLAGQDTAQLPPEEHHCQQLGDDATRAVRFAERRGPRRREARVASAITPERDSHYRHFKSSAVF